MEAARERSIILVPIEEEGADLSTACGLRVKTKEVTAVLYRRRPTPHQTNHNILHELMHEWFDHGTSLSSDEMMRYVPPALRRGLVERFGAGALVQARARYGTPEEREAELSASLLKRMVRNQVVTGDDMVSLIEASLSHPVAPRLGRRR
ncbi:hypothetical protein ABZ023_34295 [Streptomyces sp. NPDC006367]|uniref:hypothetical protein n=1 Tax=unclassified Streptomyces TaxID=2593676 RepID=UPI0033B229FD